jgi:hypothetical protein
LLHIVRNPLNVVASMLLGRQVAVPDVHGAINYWAEAVQIAATLRAAAPDRTMTCATRTWWPMFPARWPGVLRFADLAAPPGLFARTDAHPERNLWRDALAPAEREAVVSRCGALARDQGYDLEACVVSSETAS